MADYPSNLPEYVPPPAPPAKPAAPPPAKSTFQALKDRGSDIMGKVDSMVTGKPFDAR
jgi:hypothetical protein